MPEPYPPPAREPRHEVPVTGTAGHPDHSVMGGAQRCAGAVWYPPRLVGAARPRSRTLLQSAIQADSGACVGTRAGELACHLGSVRGSPNWGKTLLSENQVMAQMRSSSRVSTIIP